jgi:hypothetical protein
MRARATGEYATRATWECASHVAGEYATRATGEYATRAVLLGARCDVLDQRARRDGRVGYYGARGVVESSGQGALERSRVSGPGATTDTGKNRRGRRSR